MWCGNGWVLFHCVCYRHFSARTFIVACYFQSYFRCIDDFSYTIFFSSVGQFVCLIYICTDTFTAENYTHFHIRRCENRIDHVTSQFVVAFNSLVSATKNFCRAQSNKIITKPMRRNQTHISLNRSTSRQNKSSHSQLNVHPFVLLVDICSRSLL